jgi:hypothetical protein
MFDGSGVKLPKDWISESQDNGGTANLARKKKIKNKQRATSEQR